tara:strand:- start:3909 stop:4151 length:243 start_codon:yes stop_codon:yes gene_type:complete
MSEEWPILVLDKTEDPDVRHWEPAIACPRCRYEMTYIGKYPDLYGSQGLIDVDKWVCVMCGQMLKLPHGEIKPLSPPSKA